jgi:hypothetical protein
VVKKWTKGCDYFEIRNANTINERSISARTTGKAKRTIKKALIPVYRKKGMGWITDPKKAAYNKVYKTTTFSIFDLFK